MIIIISLKVGGEKKKAVMLYLNHEENVGKAFQQCVHSHKFPNLLMLSRKTQKAPTLKCSISMTGPGDFHLALKV